MLSACGSEPRQDENEPTGDYEVKVTMSKFPTKQRLVEPQKLKLEIENESDKTIPELAITVFTDEGEGDGSFEIRSNQRGLAIPSRPVWILEDGFPQLADEGPPLGQSGASRAQTQTWGFGSMPAGTTKTAIWKVTPVQPGTYTLNYVVAAGLDGNANAVTADGGEVKGEFVVTISDKPPKTRVNGDGEVVPAN